MAIHIVASEHITVHLQQFARVFNKFFILLKQVIAFLRLVFVRKGNEIYSGQLLKLYFTL